MHRYEQRKSRGRMSCPALKLLVSKPYKLAAVAMANKLARIAWALMVTGEPFKRTPA